MDITKVSTNDLCYLAFRASADNLKNKIIELCHIQGAKTKDFLTGFNEVNLGNLSGLIGYDKYRINLRLYSSPCIELYADYCKLKEEYDAHNLKFDIVSQTLVRLFYSKRYSAIRSHFTNDMLDTYNKAIYANKDKIEPINFERYLESIESFKHVEYVPIESSESTDIIHFEFAKEILKI